MNLKPVTASAAGIDTGGEEQYRILIDSITDYAIFLLNPEGYISTWNTGAKQIKGYDAEEIIGKHFSIFYTKKDVAENHPAAELSKAILEGKYTEEGWRVKKDGSVFWANVVITPVYNKDQQLIAFSKVTRDLSERKKAEDDLYRAFEELKESEERFRLLIEGVTDYAIFMLDPGGNVATWNHGARRMNGYEAHEIIGKYFSRFYSQEQVEEGFRIMNSGRQKSTADLRTQAGAIGRTVLSSGQTR
nr:PAS domain S-box protein [Pontibacter sp. BAB1700]